LKAHLLYRAWATIFDDLELYKSKSDWEVYQVTKDIFFHINNTDFYAIYKPASHLPVPPRGFAIQVFIDGKSKHGGTISALGQNLNGPDMEACLWALYLKKRSEFLKFNEVVETKKIDAELNDFKYLKNLTLNDVRKILGYPIKDAQLIEF
jgi:hypothetical protein